MNMLPLSLAIILLKRLGLTQDRFEVFIAFARKLVYADGSRAQRGRLERQMFVFARFDDPLHHRVDLLALLRDRNNGQRKTCFFFASADRDSADETKVPFAGEMTGDLI